MDAVVARCSHSALPCPASKLELVVYERAAAARPGPTAGGRVKAHFCREICGAQTIA